MMLEIRRITRGYWDSGAWACDGGARGAVSCGLLAIGCNRLVSEADATGRQSEAQARP